MSNINNGTPPYKNYNYRIPDTYKDYVEQARSCNQCREPTIVEYNLRTQEVGTYELDPYPRQRIEHRHPADIVTRTSVISSIAVEKRLLHKKRSRRFPSHSREGFTVN